MRKQVKSGRLLQPFRSQHLMSVPGPANWSRIRGKIQIQSSGILEPDQGKLPKMQEEIQTVKEEVCFNMSTRLPPPAAFPPGPPSGSPRTKPPPREAFPESLGAPFSQFRYDAPPGDPGGSRKRKSVPSKMPSGGPAAEAPPVHPPPLRPPPAPAFLAPLARPQPPKPPSQMIDLCNVGFQFYRTLERFGGQPVKREPVQPGAPWPPPPFLPVLPFPYYPQAPRGLVLPFPAPNRPAGRPPQPPQGPARPGPPRAGAEGGPQVERVDVNVRIDDSYYVDVGGEQKRWQCPTCAKSYTSKYNLVTHILGHSGVKPHACARCGKLFKQLSHLHTHLLTHQGTRPHKCQVCLKAFTQTSHLKRHMMQHSDVKPHSCRVCGRGFAYPSELRAHEAKHEAGRCHVCVECGLDFPTLAQLKRHLTAHRGPVQYRCGECPKAFQYPSQLQNHMMKHKDIRPHICSECGMEFVQPHHLKQHSLTHKGVKEHKCGICGREFTLLANMKRHVLIHTNIRAYQCHLCFKSFVQKQTLKAHMIVHSDVKPFKCKLCGKEFNRMHNLMGHMHLHSDSKPFKCLYCPSKFTLKGNLTRHMKVKHGVLDKVFHSPGLGRGRGAPTQTAGALRSLEQEEPFDLSQKTRTKGVAFHSDGESAKGSSCPEEDEDHCSESERYSPGPLAPDHHHLLSRRRGLLRKGARRARRDAPSLQEREQGLSHGFEQKEKESQRAEGSQERNCAHKDDCLGFRPFPDPRLGHSLSDYLYFKHRNESLKELLERKMEKQAVLLGL
ncbi:zinc finger protein 366 [Tachyglossus aculeatus]|uniref:zinc finger protein 366 n=1 Tax=Tachyglossus aculeatus TaxID=9261 RepID=UPI0018F38E75|nr:zinc finger protein 366 [Tachyglossus aculeatus]